jgi:hypothetical protein
MATDGAKTFAGRVWQCPCGCEHEIPTQEIDLEEEFLPLVAIGDVPVDPVPE